MDSFRIEKTADVVADVTMLSCAQRVHEAVHGSEGEAGSELPELEDRMHSLFEARFGASFEDVTGYETTEGH
ncbi:DUF7545 family protein [Haladaptatus halobius]|uniref:DUF7545 family protein n=1 Tax=Haladaptatus halobius TaxID=2884875 RepID=UPI001D09D893|nr:hypothetical protein [Haladaptatus halobius]